MEKLGRRLALGTEMQGDFLLQAKAPIDRWLAEKAATLVLPPDLSEPRSAVLSDSFLINGRHFTMIITAWDECGKVPHAFAREGGALRHFIPGRFLELVDRAKGSGSIPLGLDEFCRRADRVYVFPTASAEGLGSFVATHNTDHPTLNVATAPLPVVEAVMRDTGRGGFEAIKRAREKGLLPTLEAAAPEGNDTESPRLPKLAVGSTCFSFRIDLEVGSAKRSYWEVVENNKGSWRCVERLAIPY